jgi:integrase
MIVRLYENGEYWQAKWTDALGRRRTRGLGRRGDVSRREAEKLCAKISASEAANPSKDGKAPTLKEWTDKYIELRKSELADGTLGLHKLTIKYLIDHFGEDVRINRFNRMSASEWSAGLGLGEQSRCMHVRNAKVIFGWATDRDLIQFNPFDRENGTPAAVDKTWTEIDDTKLEMIFEACPNDGWRRLFAMCRWAGLRRGEAMRLTWSDIDFDTSVLNVRAEKTTTKSKARTVPIVPKLLKMLLAGHAEAPDDSEGPTDGVRNVNLAHAADAIVERAGLPEYAKPFHTLRKCCESEWMAQFPVLDVASWLGHSPTVAAKHYVRTTPETLAKVTKIVPKSSQTGVPKKASTQQTQ